ncbi:unnamed protein product [Adineta steineri]|uniref:Uncharacterized protein n=1 Tax=Adineta steineri TaxID=433720 RepID=A0A813TDA9_9BILA|nr:unnamed protein product [Adineta steineri]
MNALCTLVNQTISNSLIQFYSNQYVSASVTPSNVFQLQTKAFISQFISSTINGFLLSLTMIRNITQSNALLSGELINFGFYLSTRYSLIPNSRSYGNCTCTSSATCISQSAIYGLLNDAVLFNVPGVYTGCYIIESLLQSSLQCFYNQTCINKLQSYFQVSSLMNVTALDISLSNKFFENSTIADVLDQLMVEEWSNSSIYENYYSECQPSRLHQICDGDFVTQQWIDYLATPSENSKLNYTDFRLTGTFTFQTMNALCTLVNQTISNSLIQFYSNQYVSASVTPSNIFQLQTDAFVSQFISSTTNGFLLSLAMIRNTTQSNSLFSGHLTNYLLYESGGAMARIARRYGNCTCTSSVTCISQSPMYDLANDTILFSVPGLYTGCYIIESLLQSDLQCFYDQACINKLQLYLGSSTLMNVTALDISLSIQYLENSTIADVLDQLMVEEWKNSSMYENYYNECQPSRCTYTVPAKNSAIYIVTTLIGLVGGLITVFKLMVPYLIECIMFCIKKCKHRSATIIPVSQT